MGLFFFYIYFMSYGIKEMSLEDRPREKLIKLGAGALSNSELLAIVLNSGSRSKSVIELSKEVYANFNHSLISLGKASPKELECFEGIGEAKSVSVVAALELGRRMEFHKEKPVSKILSSSHAFDILFPKLGFLEKEEFWAIYLDRSNKVIDITSISMGGVSSTVVDPRIVFKAGVSLLASGIIVGHNHPSGNLEASHADILLTEKLKKAGELLDIKLLDHLIIASDAYFSFADENLL